MDEKPEVKETRQLTGDEKASAGLIEKVKEGGTALKQRAIEEAKGYKDVQDTQLWKSIFRVSHDRSDPRNRSLAVLSNVFLHLHPAKVNRDAVRYQYTWGMGGITFYLFIVLTFTGVLLMFYYHPTKVDAFRDILYLEHDVPFGKLLRNMHRWAAHLMVITTWLHMFRVVLTGSYKRPREFNWGVGVVLLVLTLSAFVYGLLAARRSTRLLGGDSRNKHGAGDTDAGFGGTVWSSAWHDAFQRRSVWTTGRIDSRLECVAAFLHLALHRHSARGVDIYGGALLAHT